MLIKNSVFVLHSLQKKSVKVLVPRQSPAFFRDISNLSYRHQVGSDSLKYVPLGQLVAEAADRWPGRAAVISRHEEKTLTFSQLLEESDRLAAALKNMGMEKGDRVGIWLPNYSQWVVAMLAASRIGLISVAINHMYRQKEMSYALKKVGVKTLIAAGSRANSVYYKVLTDIIPELPSSQPGSLTSKEFEKLKCVVLIADNGSPGTISYESLLKLASTEDINQISREVHLINPDSGCNIQYTSGTTGNPKAALLSHYNLVNNSFGIGKRNELVDKKICVQIPLFHVFGVTVTIGASIQHGSTMVLPSPIYSPKSNLETLLTEKCEVIHGTPTMYVDLVNEVRSRNVTQLKNCEIAVTGGSAVTPNLVQDMADVLNVSKIKSIYGMTECSAVSFQSVSGEDPQRPLHYLGLLHDHLEAKIVNEENEIVPYGSAGELVIRGYSTMMGYWGDQKKTQETIDETGWLRTGDQVALYEDGYSQIVGRIKDIIIRGGENIAPKEIEDVMSTHPDVLECQVFAIQDDRLGEDVCAAVRLREGAEFNEKTLQKHISNTLAKYKVPRLIKKIDEFPKTASGKVQKFKLREMVESGRL